MRHTGAAFRWCDSAPGLALLLVAVTGFGCDRALASDTGLAYRDSLSGGFGGLTQAFADHGLDLAVVYTGEIATVDGGLRDGHAYLDNTDITLEADLGESLGISGGTFFVYVLGNNGGSASKFAGDMQVVSNIDSPDTWKLYEFWYQQNWRDDRFSLRAGLYDFNSEFDAIDTAGLFINSSFGIGAEIAQTGENGPSIFPTTSLALRGLVSLDNGFYVQAAVLDGVPGNPDRPNGTHIKLSGDEGAFLAAETGYVHAAGDRPGCSCGYRKFALGTWRYTAALDTDALGNPVAARENRGVYALAEGMLLPESGDAAQGLAGFLRYGVADDRLNQLDAFTGGGFVYTGLFPGRDADQLGLAFARAQNGDRFRDLSRLGGAPVERAETAIELSYRAQLTPWLAVQPDYQYVVDPGTDPAVDNAHVLMLRFEIIL